MKLPVNTITAAIVLTALTVTVPCTAWYIAGSQSVEIEREQIIGLMRLKANQTASSLAGRIGGRLGVLLDTESRRPVYQYQHTYADPNTACDCASITPSPLALGPEDALIKTQFQISPAGQLSIPTLGNQIGGNEKMEKEREWLRTQYEMRSRLQKSTGAIKKAVEIRERESDGNNANPRKMASQVVPAWNGEEVVVIEVEVPRLEWHVIDVGGDSTLVALRDVATPVGTVIQGFVVSTEEVTKSMEGAFLPARFVTDGKGGDLPSGVVGARVPLEGVDWMVQVDAGDAVVRAEEEGAGIARHFRITFALSSAAALVAGIFVIGLVWQTERLSRERSQFAAAAAHELRTPLAGLQLYSDMLAQGLGNRERSRDYAARIAGESQRLARVVSNVLGFSQLERRSVTLHAEKGDLDEAVGECLDRLRPAFESRGFAIGFQRENPIPPATFDREALFHIVQNLLDNAEKFTRRSDRRTVDVALRPVDGGVALSVSDHGEGIPDTEKRKLFRSFAPSGREDSPPGLGLGLLLVREFSEAQGGSVTCSDTPGGGATFTVIFPA